MEDEELIGKWKSVLNHTDKHLTPLKEEDRLKCAKEMEEVEQGEGEYAYKVNMVPAIRKKYSDIPMVIENIDGKEYLVHDVNVTECIYEEVPSRAYPKWEEVNKTVKWYFPILEDKSDESYASLCNIHVFGRGYTDGIYHNTPKYGSSSVTMDHIRSSNDGN